MVGEVLDAAEKLAERRHHNDLLLHEMDLRNVASEVVFINDGVIQENTTREFFENPKNERLEIFSKNDLISRRKTCGVKSQKEKMKI